MSAPVHVYASIPVSVTPNQRMKLTGRGGRLNREAFLLDAAAAARNLCAFR